VLKVAARFNKKNLPKGELAPLPNIRRFIVIIIFIITIYYYHYCYFFYCYYCYCYYYYSNPSFFFNIGPFTELWADHRRQAALISAIWFLQSFSIYGISLWLSEYVAFKGLPETDTRLRHVSPFAHVHFIYTFSLTAPRGQLFIYGGLPAFRIGARDCGA
jgi:hypothetical protein